jgi:serine kinase of HPr protein (carbohydrate metabolism regulator)
MLVHGTCIEIDGLGVLLRAPSGGGKSDLALRLIDDGAHLVADDQVELTARAGRLVATAPLRISGRMEVRGLGIVEVPSVGTATVGLIVDLVEAGDVPRLPRRRDQELAGITLPSLALAPFEASAAAKVRLAVRAESRNSTTGLAAARNATSDR